MADQNVGENQGTAGSKDIWVFSEKPVILAELVGGAAGLALQTGGKVVALVLGPRFEAGDNIAANANRIIYLGQMQQDQLVEDFVPTITALVETHKPHILLVGATLRGKAVAGRVAARLGLNVITDVREMRVQNQAVEARHHIFGGGAIREERALTQPVIATVAPGAFEIMLADNILTGVTEEDIIEAPFIEPEWRIVRRERKVRPETTIDLSAAKSIVCAGRGIAMQEDLGLVDELAHLLGAEIACTRPLAEGLDWLPRERYIGISGAIVKPALYLGVGVSGQAQHVIGMSDARVVVAINKDSSAPILSMSDYAIVGDLYQILPALIQALKARRE